MATGTPETSNGLAALRLLVWGLLDPENSLVPATTGHDSPAHPGGSGDARAAGWLRSEAHGASSRAVPGRPPGAGQGTDANQAISDEADAAEATRVIALVELARAGDAEAFGQLYDRYQPRVYRFIYYRVGSAPLAEDLTSDTFFRALRSMASFRWQGKDFGAWLTTIARNLTTDHFKAGRTRLEYSCEDMVEHDRSTPGPETSVLSALTNERLLRALRSLPHDQQECLIMRFLQGMSIAETAEVLGRSAGAVKQLQLRGVRGLAALVPEEL